MIWNFGILEFSAWIFNNKKAQQILSAKNPNIRIFLNVFCFVIILTPSRFPNPIVSAPILVLWRYTFFREYDENHQWQNPIEKWE